LETFFGAFAGAENYRLSVSLGRWQSQRRWNALQITTKGRQMNVSNREHALAVALAEILGNVTPVNPDPASVLENVRKIAVKVLHEQFAPLTEPCRLVLLPDGYKVVPVDPTDAQLIAVLGGKPPEPEKVLLAADYTAMVNAGPDVETLYELQKS
jgi:hypothetical protein